MAKLEDDRLIQALPLSIEQATKAISSEQMQAYECAFQADVISLLRAIGRGKIRGHA